MSIKLRNFWEKIEKIKIESLGIRDQQRSGECWLYTIVQIILYANSRMIDGKMLGQIIIELPDDKEVQLKMKQFLLLMIDILLELFKELCYH